MSGRRLSRQSIKGPIFPSMRDQNTRPKRIMTWKPGTQSTRQQKRHLRQRVHHMIDSVDPLIIAAGDRVIRSVAQEPDPEYSALHLFCAALDASDDTGESWVTCMHYLMDKFDGAVPVSEEEIVDGESQPERSQDGSILRRLLRSLVPRALRQSDERTAQPGDDQSAGAGAAQHESQD